jgi:type II secretory pathway component HofQ
VPLLKNPRHEKFALALAEGKSATDAYALAGYKSCRQNAHRMITKDDIQARLAEIQGAAAKASEVTIESLLNELEAARAKATDLDQLSAAVRAIEAKAKVSGLLVQKMEVGAPGAFETCQSVAEIADEMLQYQPPYRPVTEQERQGLIDLLNEQGNVVQEYLDALKAKPINPTPYSQRRTELARLGNGKSRS